MNERMIERLRELDVEDSAIVLISYMYNNGDITEEDIFDIGDDEEFNIENIENYELNEPIEVYEDAIGNNISYNGEDWYVFNNEEDAIAAAEEDVKLLIDDIGISGINFDVIGPLSEYVNTDWFEDAERESFEYYCDDIADENDSTYGNRLVEECYHANLIDDNEFETDEDGKPDYTSCIVNEETLKKRYVDYHMEDIDDFVEYYIFEFGEKDFNNVVIEKGLIDVDKLAEAVVEADGPANSLASYDGEEYTQDFEGTTWYLYRSN